MRAAIQTGYTKGFATIVDANVVTAITALVLFAVATASVRGFALMLLVGTAISMLTAVVATRAFLAVLAGLKLLDSPRLMGAAGGGIPRWLKLDYIGRRNTWFAISGVVVVIAVGAIAIKGLNLGIDFRGGTQIAFETPQPVSLDQVRAQAAEIGQANAQIQGRGPVHGRQLPLVHGPHRVARAERGAVPAAEPREHASRREAFGVKNVSASFGRQIAKGRDPRDHRLAALIVLYISVRFQWKFAVPVLVALAHDVLITIGIYALLGREVTTATVAAVLTVLGYSIYDTIIIFDRIRENIPLMKRASFRVLGNVSLWETIPRSLATTFITLVPIASLWLFGGDTLKDFAFALLVGIGAGRLLLDLHRRAAPRDVQGARAGVRAAPRRRARGRRVGRRRPPRTGDARARGRGEPSRASPPRLPPRRSSPPTPRSARPRRRGASGGGSAAAGARTGVPAETTATGDRAPGTAPVDCAHERSVGRRIAARLRAPARRDRLGEPRSRGGRRGRRRPRAARRRRPRRDA